MEGDHRGVPGLVVDGVAGADDEHEALSVLCYGRPYNEAWALSSRVGPSVRTRLSSIWLILVAVLFSACVDATGNSVAPKTGEDPSAPDATDIGEAKARHIVGIVVDPEFVPIAEAAVVVTPGDVVGVTNAAGAFDMGPFDPGEYTVMPEKDGYKAEPVKVRVVDDKPAEVRLVLQPVGRNVPYHETGTYNAYITCHVVLRSSDLNQQIGNLPCAAVIDLVQPGISTDKWIYKFKVEQTGFSGIVLEMTWQPQQFGHDGLMQMKTTGTIQATGGGVQPAGTVYGDTMSAPFHAVLTPGNSYWVNAGQPVTFYPTPNVTQAFEVLLGGGGDNTTLRGSAAFIDYRPTAFATLFYNRPPARDFTTLPDK